MTFRLMPDRARVGEGFHRSGWCHIFSQLEKVSDPSSPLLLDDFFDLNHGRAETQKHYKNPWVGIFHFPREINSPIRSDKYQTIFNVLSRGAEHLSTLRGVICLSQDLADGVCDFFRGKMPICILKHPTQTDSVLQWHGHYNRLFQVGFYLRDTRAIHKIDNRLDSGWLYYRSLPWVNWMENRDKALYKNLKSFELPGGIVDISRMSDEDYDMTLASSVCLSHVFGASANNVVVECIARGTPLVINKHPAVVEYLGEKYPLYFQDKPKNHTLRDLHQWLTEDRITAAHKHMVELQAKPELTVPVFVERVRGFCARLC